jgi:hypothetical protein
MQGHSQPPADAVPLAEADPYIANTLRWRRSQRTSTAFVVPPETMFIIESPITDDEAGALRLPGPARTSLGARAPWKGASQEANCWPGAARTALGGRGAPSSLTPGEYSPSRTWSKESSASPRHPRLAFTASSWARLTRYPIGATRAYERRNNDDPAISIEALPAREGEGMVSTMGGKL